MRIELETIVKKLSDEPFEKQIHQYSSVRKRSTYFQVGEITRQCHTIRKKGSKPKHMPQKQSKVITKCKLAFVHYCPHNCSSVHNCSRRYYPELLSKLMLTILKLQVAKMTVS